MNEFLLTFRKNVISGLKWLLFWMIFFQCQRLIFTIFHNDLWLEYAKELPLVIFHSLRLDLATAAFLSVIPLFGLFLFNLHKKDWLKKVLKGIIWTQIILVSCIHGGEILAYYEWNHKLTSRVFMHLSNPDEVVRTASTKMILAFVTIVILEWLIARFFLRKLKIDLILETIINRFKKFIFNFIGFLFTLSIYFLFARGGWQQIPINIDAAYFSKNQKINDLSVNAAYFFGNSFFLYTQKDFARLVPSIPEKEALSLVDNLYNFDRHHGNLILDNQRPNVVFIILESWTANAIGALSEQKGATPHFDQLVEKGLLFTNIYAVNTTSEIGNTAILAGFPGIPEVAISLYPEKHRKIITINQLLKKNGYFSAYLFAGDLKYGNIEGFLAEHQFDEILDEDDFPSGLEHGKLTFHDKDLYAFFLQRLNRSKEPFIQCVFTGSTHSPYDYPKQKVKFKGTEADFMNAIHYADACLGQFFDNARKQSWYKNTLFVLVADHSHGSTLVPFPNQSPFFRIPLLFYGEPIKAAHRGKKIAVIGSQTDIATTLSYQLGFPTKDFPFSKDLLSPNVKSFAFHAMVGGYGFVNEKGSFLYHFDQKDYVYNTFREKYLKQAKLQNDALYSRYFDYFDALDRIKPE
jgi:phosphoglycerol transferase MdoB-like AlkP superfamily enzyme